MVGKSGETKSSSRIFHQCYLKCCKLQNLTPLATVIPGQNGKVLDFCVDRIKYQDWPPILNALSCDLSLHSVSIRCRQPVKTILEHIDCERLAKTVNKRSVILTNFMLSNLVEAISQLLSNTTLLTSLLLEGIPLKIPYLNPICEALLLNSSLQHLHFPRCLIGDAGCLAVCKAVRCLPNILTLDLNGCELTCLGAGYISDLVKYQKIHRYSENWVHTLRYRLPELDAMAGLRRITVCANPQLGDQGMSKLLDILSDDLWIKALDAQNCGLTEETAQTVMQIMHSNTTLVVLDLRHNADICVESLSQVRAVLREHERMKGVGGQYSWLGNVSGCSHDGRSVKSIASKNVMSKDSRLTTTLRNISSKYSKTTVTKKEKDYTELLEEQLQEEISHRHQLEELNSQLVDQMKQLKQQQLRLWSNSHGATSSGSEQSFEASSPSGNRSSSSESNKMPINQDTLYYVQEAFKDIYAFIRENQCHGECRYEVIEDSKSQSNHEGPKEFISETELRVVISPKKCLSTYNKVNVKVEKSSKSAHTIGDTSPNRSYISGDMGADGELPQKRKLTSRRKKPEMFERQMGDSRNARGDDLVVAEEIMLQQKAKRLIDSPRKEYQSPCSSVVSDSSDTLVVSPRHSECSGRSRSNRSITSVLCVNPREALCSTTDDESEDSSA